jgi:hypothetical protein
MEDVFGLAKRKTLATSDFQRIPETTREGFKGDLASPEYYIWHK